MRNYSLNDVIKIKAFFANKQEEAVNVSELKVSIKKPNGELKIFNTDFVNPETGFYYLTYIEGDEIGKYSFVWEATLEGVASRKEGEFNITGGGVISTILPELEKNELVVIEIEKSVEGLLGEKLGETTYITFTTEYEPFYCSTDMLLMELGPWAENIPEDTLALAIHWSSLEAEHITGKKPVSSRHSYASSKFVMYDAAINLLRMPVGYSGASGGRKQLGDLLVDNGSIDFSLKDLVNELKLERDEWFRVVNAGGAIVPGQGLGPSFAVKGNKVAEKTQISREWHDPWNEYYAQPSANSKYRRPGESKYKSGYTRWSENYFTGVTKGIKR
jgi:hypothetical protein